MSYLYFQYISTRILLIFISKSVFYSKQSKQSKLDSLNQRAQELMRLADSVNHTQIDDKISELNNDWNKKLNELESNIGKLNVLSSHWQDFEKRIELLENQLSRLEEKISNTDFVVKSRQHLLDTKDIYRVSNENNLLKDIQI